jgi:hypothetical protein
MLAGKSAAATVAAPARARMAVIVAFIVKVGMRVVVV